MNINVSTSIPSHALSIKSTIENVEPETQFVQDIEKKQDASLMSKQNSNILEGLSEKYDVTNATFDELNEISTALYNAGEISLKEHTTSIFDFDRATDSLKREISGMSPQILAPSNEHHNKIIGHTYRKRRKSFFVSWIH